MSRGHGLGHFRVIRVLRGPNRSISSPETELNRGLRESREIGGVPVLCIPRAPRTPRLSVLAHFSRPSRPSVALLLTCPLRSPTLPPPSSLSSAPMPSAAAAPDPADQLAADFIAKWSSVPVRHLLDSEARAGAARDRADRHVQRARIAPRPHRTGSRGRRRRKKPRGFCASCRSAGNLPASPPASTGRLPVPHAH